MSYSKKVKQKLDNAKQNTDYMKLAREEMQKDEAMWKLIAAGTVSVLAGGLLSLWKISSDRKDH